MLGRRSSGRFFENRDQKRVKLGGSVGAFWPARYGRGTRKIGGIPAQCGESPDVKKPNREGLGFKSGGTPECERFLRTGSDSLVQKIAASGAAVRQKFLTTSRALSNSSIFDHGASSRSADNGIVIRALKWGFVCQMKSPDSVRCVPRACS